MKKRVAVLLFLILLAVFIPVVLADEKVDKAYSCLEGKVKGKCSTLSSEEQAFSLLALAYNSDIQKECKSALMSSSKDEVCWPKSGCKLRDTSLAMLALENIKADTSKTQDWLLNQTQTPSDLLWYLELDSKEATTCKISYDDRNYTIGMQSDKKLSSGAGSCLILAYSNYWLQIASNCVNKKFSVTCDKDFSTALLYKKSNSDVWFVSSQTQSESAGGMAETKVESLCFKQGSACDYEGSLWATLALSTKQDINKFLPYIIALAPDNEKYNPSAFFYLLTSNDEYLSNVRDSQTQTGFWDLGSSYSKFYDTALSLLALQQLSDEQSGKAKDWLLNSQDSAGCWSNLRDTAFLLYAGWPKTPASIGTSETNCEDFSKFCCSNEDCSDAGGEILSQYFCAGMKVCCSKQPIEKTCTQKQGIICKSDETCTGSLGSSSDSNKCCINGDCEQVQEEPECEKQGNNCRNECLDTEEIDNSLDCNNNQFCCKIKETKSSSAWIWVLIIFVILIILVVLAIIFRDKLRLWLFQMKNRFNKGGSPVTQTRPPFPPQPPRPMMRPMPRPMQKPMGKPMGRTKTDSELDDTLKKLREMSK